MYTVFPSSPRSMGKIMPVCSMLNTANWLLRSAGHASPVREEGVSSVRPVGASATTSAVKGDANSARQLLTSAGSSLE